MSDLQLRRYSNQAPDTILNGAISNTATSLTVTVASGFPDPPFTIKIDNEVMLVTAVSGFDFTVTREYDGSDPAASHADGAEVKHVLTADDFGHRWQDVIVTPGYDDLDDEFDDGDHSGLTKVTPTGTVDWTEANGVLSAVANGQASADAAAAMRTLSTAAIGSGIQTAVRVAAVTNYIMAGPIFSSGTTTTHNVVWQFMYLTPDSYDRPTYSLRSGTFDNISATAFNDVAAISSGWLHMRLVWVGVNVYRAWWSVDGVSWTDFGKGQYVITGVNPPTHMGVGVSSWGSSTDSLATFEYLRIWEP